MNTKGLKVKANIKKHFVCGGVILLCYVYLLTHEISDAAVYGFWAGLWQGGIFLPKFIISLFLDNVKFIAKNRTLGYDIAFFFVNIVSLFNDTLFDYPHSANLFGNLSTKDFSRTGRSTLLFL